MAHSLSFNMPRLLPELRWRTTTPNPLGVASKGASRIPGARHSSIRLTLTHVASCACGTASGYASLNAGSILGPCVLASVSITHRPDKDG